MRFNNGDTALYNQKENNMEGTYVFVPKDRSYVVVSNYKDDKETQKSTVYIASR